jgi:hypothetical protein
MKPLGMTPDYLIVTPTYAQNTIWDAVEEAISAAMTPEQFKREAAEAWRHVLSEDAKRAAKILNS